jgi:hypothetical protein
MVTSAVLWIGSLVPALDGEAGAEAGGNATTTAALSAVSLVIGYAVLFALWRYIFSPRARAKRGEDRD